MTKSLRVAVLSAILALSAAPVFAGPGGGDPPPPPPTNNYSAAVVSSAVLASLGF